MSLEAIIALVGGVVFALVIFAMLELLRERMTR